MQKPLSRLNQTPGVVGCFVVDADGMILASDMRQGMDDETVGALASGIAHAISRASDSLGQGAPTSIALETANSKLFFQPLPYGYLVTLANKEARIGLVRMEMRSAARALIISHDARG